MDIVLHDSIYLFIFLNILSPMAKNRLQPLKYEWFYHFMVRILANINLLVLLVLSIFDFIHCQNIKVLKLSIKSGKQGIKSPCSTHVQDVISNMVPKNYTWAQGGMKLKFWVGLVMNSVSCWVSYPCIALRSPHLGPLHLCLHLHCLYLLTSHVYFNAHTLIVRACINSGVS
jgi:hypothetical protein